MSGSAASRATRRPSTSRSARSPNISPPTPAPNPPTIGRRWGGWRLTARSRSARCTSISCRPSAPRLRREPSASCARVRTPLLSCRRFWLELPRLLCVRGSLKPRRGRLADNAINGIPACGNEWLLQKVARDAWNRSDVIIQSDCGAVSNIYHQHHAVQVTLLSAFSCNAQSEVTISRDGFARGGFGCRATWRARRWLSMPG